MTSFDVAFSLGFSLGLRYKLLEVLNDVIDENGVDKFDRAGRPRHSIKFLPQLGIPIELMSEVAVRSLDSLDAFESVVIDEAIHDELKLGERIYIHVRSRHYWLSAIAAACLLRMHLWHWLWLRWRSVWIPMLPVGTFDLELIHL